jgi:drug/metabolite transporter (DMT)-like permease
MKHMTASRVLPALSGATGMVCVGGSVAVSGVLAGAPLATLQSLRYAVACLLLLVFARVTGRRPVRPRGAEWLWLLGVTAAGLLLFNVALVHGSRHAEPAVLGVAVACVPILLALLGPLLEGHGPAPAVVAAAVVVTAGAALVQGAGRADAIGIGWAVVTFVCEAGFTLMAVPLLGRHGPIGVSVHTTWLAAVLFGVAAAITDGGGGFRRITADQWLATAYLAVAVTAVAFVLWYTAVARLGAGPAGLLTGVAPVAAAVFGVALGGPAPSRAVWAGITLVALGLAIGMSRNRPPQARWAGSLRNTNVAMSSAATVPSTSRST